MVLRSCKITRNPPNDSPDALPHGPAAPALTRPFSPTCPAPHPPAADHRPQPTEHDPASIPAPPPPQPGAATPHLATPPQTTQPLLAAPSPANHARFCTPAPTPRNVPPSRTSPAPCLGHTPCGHTLCASAPCCLGTGQPRPGRPEYQDSAAPAAERPSPPAPQPPPPGGRVPPTPAPGSAHTYECPWTQDQSPVPKGIHPFTQSRPGPHSKSSGKTTNPRPGPLT